MKWQRCDEKFSFWHVFFRNVANTVYVYLPKGA